MKKELWYKIFSQGDVPAYPCPTCGTGHLQLKKGNLRVERPNWVKQDLAEIENSPEMDKARFTMLLYCTRESCGEIVAVAGDIEQVEVGTEHGWGFEPALRPASMTPAPFLLEIPKQAPAEVAGHLKAAFALYWGDLGACANRIRSAGEAILDSLTVPRQKRIKAKPATGNTPARAARTVDLDYNGRIQWLQKRNKRQASILDAFRIIGNLGSHGNEVTADQIIKGLAMMEYLLTELYVKHEILRLANEVVHENRQKKAKKKKKR